MIQSWLRSLYSPSIRRLFLREQYNKVLPCLMCYKEQNGISGSRAASRLVRERRAARKTPNQHALRKKEKFPVVSIYDNMTVQELADSLEKDTEHVFEVMLYIPHTDRYNKPSSEIDNIDVIKEIVRKSGCKFVSRPTPKTIKGVDKDAYKRAPAESSDMVKCPPVVTIMGHVDHGKTTLLDQLRKSNIVDQEFGGITQHIGAFSVKLPTTGEMITFLDTPGHAAFSAMRARGANATDMIVLVVAAEDGVMSQTSESIELAKKADVPIIVAINKIDKQTADIEGTKKGLLSEGLVVEEYGGDIQVVPISALKGTNLVDLQEAIVTQAELQDIKADPAGLVEGVVIESKTDIGRGKLSTALIKRGTLKKGSLLVAGLAHAKVRAMFNDMGQPIQAATPGTPVEILGWKVLPSAGDLILQLESEKRVKEVISYRENVESQQKMDKDSVEIQLKANEHNRVYQEKLNARLIAGLQRYSMIGVKKEFVRVLTKHEGPQLYVVIKGDVDGSIEAILDTLDTYDSSLNQCRLDVIHYGVGQITENDITLANSFNGLVIGFNVAVPESMQIYARSQNVVIKTFKVIYRLIEYLKEEINLKLPTKEVENVIGQANVLQVFEFSEGKQKLPIVGCRCTSGMLSKKKNFKIIRDSETVYDGKLISMKHHRNEVETIRTDVECGLHFQDFGRLAQPGDIVVCYEYTEVKQHIDWDAGF